MNTKNYIIIFKALLAASKSLIYSRYLITVFPFYAILIYNGFIESPLAIFLVVPFIPAFTAGFMYNTLRDSVKDPEEKNPITSGAISEKSIVTSILLLAILAVFIFILVYSSLTALLVFLSLILILLTYNGIKIRFKEIRLKESILGPAIVSFALFLSPSINILVEFNYFNFNIMLLILGLFFVYTSHEIQHTIIDYESDLLFKCRTFAVITGKKMASIAEYVLLILGFTFLLVSGYYFIGNLYIIALFAFIFLISILLTILHGVRIGFHESKDFKFITMPYTATRVYLIVLGCLILNMPVLLTLLIVWILFTDKFS